MTELRVLAPCGMLGYGIPEDSLEAGMQMVPHVIACDAGSTDQGPNDLGANKLHMPLKACRRDLQLMLRAARNAKIPMIVGSCGGAGAEEHLRVFHNLLVDVAREDNLHFRLALIHAEQDKGYLYKKLASGKIHPLETAPPLAEADIAASDHIVAVMGAEPIIEALNRGAEVILAGRSTDTSLFSAVPLRQGLAPGSVWHAAKLLECGGSSALPPSGADCLFATIYEDRFTVEPPSPRRYYNPISAAAHTLYENPSPYHLREPSGTLDTTESKYIAASPRAVTVIGSKFIPAEKYTVKLEGAGLAGFRSLTIGGIREPALISELDAYLDRLRSSVEVRVKELFHGEVGPADYDLVFHVYGRDGCLGRLEPQRDQLPHEVGLLIIVVAKTQDLANEILANARAYALHNPYKGCVGLVSNIAFPIAPADVETGPVYRFTMNHVLELEDPLEPFPIDLLEV